MTRALTHRGPDDEGYLLQAGIGLGHRRLSVIDLATGHQPLCSEEKTVWVIFNVISLGRREGPSMELALVRKRTEVKLT